MTKSFWASRTVWVAILTGAAGFFTVFGAANPTLGWVIVGKAVLDVLLRLGTTVPIV